jgi:hypothetical protein
MTKQSHRQYQADLLQQVGKRKDLWMIKTIYLVYLLRQHGVDVQWILQFEDKQELYNNLDELWKLEKSQNSSKNPT